MADGKIDQETLEIGVRLKGEMRIRYEKIKRVKGIEADAELIRLLISEEYRRLGLP
jgi:spore coat protein CotH